ncbi:hypothetical protein WA577_001225 [Blastocystis sp. JDR]
MGDSYYEYLLKGWLQSGKRDKRLKRLYDRSVDGMYEMLFGKSKKDDYLFVGEKKGNRVIKKMEQMTCFASAMLALGADNEENPERRERDFQRARGLAYTCYQMYKSMPTGLAPEYVTFADDKGMAAGGRDRQYQLRPEAIEAFYVLYSITKDPIYLEWGYDVFMAIEKHCKTAYGYGEYEDVLVEGKTPLDKMESFFPAETLKYLYLLFSPNPAIDFNKVVFNTEGHPLKRM